jgi:phosphatidylserine decarboxylase
MLDLFLPGLVLSLTTTIPLAWKWALGIPRTAVVVALLSLSTAVLLDWVAFFEHADSLLVKAAVNWLLTLSAAFALLMYRFYRDPERAIPLTPDIIVSPADGQVLYVRDSHDGVMPVSTKHGHAYTLEELTKTRLEMRAAAVIGIGMSLLDVHVNRAPISGRITLTRHIPGLFGSLRRLEMIFENSRVTTIIQQGDLQIAVIQIASRLVRQIESFVHEHDDVRQGQRIGVIRFGSQVDLVLPSRVDLGDLEVTVKPGDRLTAGESVVAIVRRAASRQGAALAMVAALTANACGGDVLASRAAPSAEEGDGGRRAQQEHCGQVIWQADHETSDLSQWYTDDGGGEFNSGAAASSVSHDMAHTGLSSVRATIHTPHMPDTSAVRLFRWNEGRAHLEACYSAWYYFPQLYIATEWWNIFSFKSRNGTAANDSFWQLQIGNRLRGTMYVYLTWWGPPLEGPRAGELGLQHFVQALRDVHPHSWTHFEVYLRQSSDFDGQIIVWQDEVELFNLNNVRTRYPAENGANEWSINNYSDSIVPSPTTIYVDDVTISIPAVWPSTHER